MKIAIQLFFYFTVINCFSQENNSEETRKEKQNLIVSQYLGNAYRYRIISKDFQDNIDQGLKKDSTIATLWQQKAMAFFKSRKYEVGMKCIDKAVVYDAKRFQPYRAFMKCIFAKTYKAAILDFKDCQKKYGNNYEMDYTYGFYIGLSYLQLNEYKKAEKYLKEYVEDLYQNRQKLEHPTALFYYGIAKYEQQKWQEAIIEFDKALKIFPNFSDVKIYKSICLEYLCKEDEAKILLEEGKNDGKNGYTINEYNVIYETYPYQLIWKK